MEFPLAVLCQDAAFDDLKRLSIYGIFRNLRLPAFPAVFERMILACQFDATDILPLEDVHVVIDLIDPDGKVTDRVLDERKVLISGPDDLGIFSFNVILNHLRFEGPGDYEFRIHVDDSLEKTVPLKVWLLA